MYRSYIVATFFLGIAACATSVPPPQDSGAEIEVPAPGSESTTDAGEVEVIDVPEVPQVAVVPAKDEVVCRMERRTGTHRAVRVCRSRAEIERSSRVAKEKFEFLRRSQTDEL